jgi:hypothetical protein
MTEVPTGAICTQGKHKIATAAIEALPAVMGNVGVQAFFPEKLLATGN